MHEVLKKLQQELATGTAGLSAEETQMRREPEKWSIQQIVDHLILSYEATREVASVRVAKRTPTKASPSIPQRLGQFMISTCGIFPTGRLAPLAVSPQPTTEERLSGDELLAQVTQSLFRMDHSLNEAQALFGPSSRAISHIVLGPMSVSQWRRFHLTHGRHHMKQIAATRNSHGAQ